MYTVTLPINVFVRLKMSPSKTRSLYSGPATQSTAASHQQIGLNHTKQQ